MNIIEYFSKLESRYKWFVSFVINLFLAITIFDSKFFIFFGVIAIVSLIVSGVTAVIANDL